MEGEILTRLLHEEVFHVPIGLSVRVDSDVYFGKLPEDIIVVPQVLRPCRRVVDIIEDQPYGSLDEVTSLPG
jgi:hypothetical protein